MLYYLHNLNSYWPYDQLLFKRIKINSRGLKMKKHLLHFVTALGLIPSLAAFGDFLPENNLHLEDSFTAGGLTEKEFNEVIDIAEDEFKDIVRKTGGRLKINRRWSDSTVNASASQFFGTWTVNMYGGLARRPEVTKDGFLMVVCHELGHHLGGYPYSSSWASNEGQSDYYATQACGRFLFKGDTRKNATYRNTIETYPKSLCDKTWNSKADQNLCYRMMEASYSIASLLGSLGGTKVYYDKPDTNKVSRTNNSHPKGQCRMDTYMAGALCDAEFDLEVIPGKDLGSNRNRAKGEEEAEKYSCMNGEKGSRPQCWFKPLT